MLSSSKDDAYHLTIIILIQKNKIDHPETDA